MSILMVITLLFPTLTEKEKKFILERSSTLDMHLDGFEVTYEHLQKIFPDYDVYCNSILLTDANQVDPNKLHLLISKSRNIYSRKELLVYRP